MKNTVEKIIKRSIKICKNWKILTRNKNFTAGQKMGANALLFFFEYSVNFQGFKIKNNQKRLKFDDFFGI